VLHDLLGVDQEFSPRFLRRYANTENVIASAVGHFHEDVVSQDYPSLEESYG